MILLGFRSYDINFILQVTGELFNNSIGMLIESVIARTNNENDLGIRTNKIIIKRTMFVDDFGLGSENRAYF